MDATGIALAGLGVSVLMLAGTVVGAYVVLRERLTGAEGRITAVEHGVDRVETDVNDMQKAAANTTTAIARLEERMEGLESKIDGQADVIVTRILAGLKR